MADSVEMENSEVFCRRDFPPALTSDKMPARKMDQLTLMKFSKFLIPFAVTGAAFSLVSCATGGKSPSGFLRNYSEMNAGYGTEDAVSSFVKSDVDLKKYDSVLIDPVTTIVATPGISPQVTEQLAAYLGNSIRSQVTGDLKLAAAPSPSTLRVRVALTDVIENQKAGKPVKTVHLAPQATLTGTLGSAEVASFISNVSFEGEILDSESGDRVAALIDHRLGKKREATAATTWLGVNSAVNHAAKGLRERFLTARAR